MPEYLFYTVDDNGEPSTVIGKAEGANCKAALSSIIMEAIGKVDHPLTNIEGVSISGEYSTDDIRDGKV